MSDDDKDGVSRRDLIGGFLRRPIKEIRDRIPEALRGAESLHPAKGPPTQSSHLPRTSYPKRMRVASDTVRANPDAAGRFVADLSAKPVEVGQSRRVVAAELGEPLVVVHGTEHHWAAATGECPVDGSDVLWHAPQDVLWCPGCGSRWRLDGSIVCGPTRVELLSLHVDEAEGVVRIDVP